MRSLRLCAALTALALAPLALAPLAAHAGNPVINTVFAADPSARVWPGDDRLWLYTSHDQPGTNTYDTMISYHVFSTSDLVNWTDYGVVFHLKSAPWAISHMWAVDCVRRNDTYYLFYCARERGTGMFRIAVASSPRPQGPFTDLGPVAGVQGGIDPAVLVDDDNQAYLVWGGGGRCNGVRLADDLRSAVPESFVDLSAQLPDFFEGPWLHKRAGKYYLSYPGLPGRKWPQHMYYAVADKPLGPYTPGGVYMREFPGRSDTNHGSIAEYKGRWYAFYHSSWLSGGKSQVRSVMADELEYDATGAIKPIVPTERGVAIAGVQPAPSRVTVLLEAEAAPAAGGALDGPTVATELPGFSAAGYVTGFGQSLNHVTVMVQSAMARQAHLKIRYAAPAGPQKLKLLVNQTSLQVPDLDPKEYEKYLSFPAAADWAEFDCGVVSLREGDNFIKLYTGRHGADIAVDWFRLEPVR